MSVEEQVLRALRHLSAERQREVADFADFLALREQTKPKGSETFSAEAAQSPPSENIKQELLPLPEFPGQVPSGWKDAVYDQR